MSVYSGELTPAGLAKGIKRIKDSFPDLPKGFHDVLAERLFELEFSDKRLMDSVNYVIDNCVYPKPAIAQFLSFDSKVKLLNYEQYIKKNNELHGRAAKFYKSVRIKGFDKPFWAHENEIIKYNLTLWTTKNT